jgi:hypothetical protein
VSGHQFHNGECCLLFMLFCIMWSMPNCFFSRGPQRKVKAVSICYKKSLFVKSSFLAQNTYKAALFVTTENRVLITQTINAILRFKANIWHCIIHSLALQFITSDFEFFISFPLWNGCCECWLNVNRTQYCTSDVNELNILLH